jgi:pimeloyl-ACP methyl ester carboxylesterase
VTCPYGCSYLANFLRLVPDRDVARRLHEQVLEMQQELARLSTRSELSVVEDSGHFIHQNRPQAVIDALREMVALAQSKPGPES